MKKWKNVTLEADLQTALNHLSDRLDQQWGFRPTISQTIRYLIRLHGMGVRDMRRGDAEIAPLTQQPPLPVAPHGETGPEGGSY